MFFELEIRPRICDTDMLGHINNTVPPVWLEEGRTYFFKHIFQPPTSMPPLLIRHIEMDFKAELFQHSEVLLQTSIKGFGNTSVKMHQEIHQNGRCCFIGTSTLVFVDPETRKPCPVPDSVKTGFAPYLLV